MLRRLLCIQARKQQVRGCLRLLQVQGSRRVALQQQAGRWQRTTGTRRGLLLLLLLLLGSWRWCGHA
jgi:hypothetical protein